MRGFLCWLLAGVGPLVVVGFVAAYLTANGWLLIAAWFLAFCVLGSIGRWLYDGELLE